MAWPRWLYTIPLRIRSIFRRDQLEQELREELQFHRDQRIQQEINSGKTAAEATRLSMLGMENLERVKEECRDTRRVTIIEQFVQDLRFAIRTLVKDPGFSVSAMLALAFGIGVNVALFSVVNSVLLRPLPYPSPDRLVSIWKWRFPGGGINASPSDFQTWRSETSSFSGLVAYLRQKLNISGEGGPEELSGLRVTSDFFSLLGVKPALGYLFDNAEIRNEQVQVVVISDRLWRSRFGGSPQAVGMSLRLNDDRYSIVGVLSPTFMFGDETPDLYLPLALRTSSALGNSLSVVARLKPSVKIDTAEAELAVLAERMRAASGEASRMNPSVVALQKQIVGDAGSLLLPLFGAVGCVLLIGCSTLANLLLARATVRKKEMALRAALGAGRRRLLRQLLTESLVLALAGGVGGVALTHCFLVLLTSARPKGLPRIEEISIDPYVLGFALLLSILTGLVFGLAPALRSSQVDLETALKDEGRSSAGNSRQWLRNGLIAGEVALSLILLICAGLLLNSFVRLVNVNPGFRADHVLTMRVTLPEYSYPDRAQTNLFFQRVLERINHSPGVREAGAVNELPLGRGVVHANFNLREDSKLGTNALGIGEGWDVRALYYVSSDFLNAIGTPLLQGRVFTDRDNLPGAPPVIIVNRTFAREFFAGADPIGKRVHLAPSDLWCTIVGVSEDMKSGGLGDDKLWLSKPGFATIYLPHSALPSFMYSSPWNMGRSMYLVVRTVGDPSEMVPVVRRAIAEIDANQPITDIRTMEQRVLDSVSVRRLGLLPILIFAVMAMVLAMSGIYGVVTYAVAQRTREVGIRMALGATGGDVLLLVMKSSIGAALAGVVLGVSAGIALSRTLANQLFGISSVDLATYLSVVALMLLSVILASYIPARRATSVDPMIALR